MSPAWRRRRPIGSRTIYEAGSGERVIGSGIAMTTDTVGWIASMTKALTGTAAMQLVEQGRLELDRRRRTGCRRSARPRCSKASRTTDRR